MGSPSSRPSELSPARVSKHPMVRPTPNTGEVAVVWELNGLGSSSCVVRWGWHDRQLRYQGTPVQRTVLDACHVVGKSIVEYALHWEQAEHMHRNPVFYQVECDGQPLDKVSWFTGDADPLQERTML